MHILRLGEDVRKAFSLALDLGVESDANVFLSYTRPRRKNPAKTIW